MYWTKLRKFKACCCYADEPLKLRIHIHSSIKSWICVKDTKKSRTWWCFRAPHRPTKATKNRKTPTPMTPATTWILETRPNHFPQAATPISNRLTSWGGKGVDNTRKQKEKSHFLSRDQELFLRRGRNQLSRCWLQNETKLTKQVKSEDALPSFLSLHPWNFPEVLFSSISPLHMHKPSEPPLFVQLWAVPVTSGLCTIL